MRSERGGIQILIGLILLCPVGFVLGQASQPAERASREAQMREAAAARRGAAAEPRPDPAAIEMFVKIETIARIPANMRAPQIATLYREAAPLMNLSVDGFLSSIPPNLFDRTAPGGDRMPPPFDPQVTDIYVAQLDSAALTMTSQEVAERISTTHSTSILRVAARRRAMSAFRQSIDDLRPLVRQDLASPDVAVAKRAADLIHSMELKEFTDQATTIYLANGPTASAASWALAWITGDTDTARRLVEDIEKNPPALSRHYLLISGLLRDELPERYLVSLLDSPDADTRYYAWMALSESDSTLRAKLLVPLLRDRDVPVKLLAIQSAFKLKPGDFTNVQLALRMLLNDPDDRIRLEVADGLASKRDMAAAQTLLSFLRDPRPPRSGYPGVDRTPTTAPAQAGARGARTESRDGLRVLMAIGRLMDSRGRRLSYNTAKWGPDDPQNAAAIKEFEQWIAQNTKATN